MLQSNSVYQSHMAFIYMNLLKDTQERWLLILYTALLGWDGAAGGVIAAIT